MRIPRHGEQAVVAFGFALALLLDLKNADCAACERRLRSNGFVVPQRHRSVSRQTIGTPRGVGKLTSATNLDLPWRARSSENLTPDATPNSRSSTLSRIAACRGATFSSSLWGG